MVSITQHGIPITPAKMALSHFSDGFLKKQLKTSYHAKFSIFFSQFKLHGSFNYQFKIQKIENREKIIERYFK